MFYFGHRERLSWNPIKLSRLTGTLQEKQDRGDFVFCLESLRLVFAAEPKVADGNRSLESGVRIHSASDCGCIWLFPRHPGISSSCTLLERKKMSLVTYFLYD